MIFGCSSTNSTTIGNLSHIDIYSSTYTTQHPLVCGEGKDYPNGCELFFTDGETRKTIHAVFSDTHSAPTDFEKHLILTGYNKGIQNRDNYTLKIPSSDYQYFVVTSWEYEK